MTWWTKRSLRSNCGRGFAVAAVLSLALLPAAAQKGDFQSRLENAHRLFNSGQMEDACELLQQLSSEKPDDKEVQALKNPACLSAKALYDREERFFNEGERLFQQGQYEDARQKYQQAASQPPKKSKYRSQIAARLKEIDAKLAAAKEERDKQAAAEREKQAEAERAKQAEAERARQAETDRAKQAEADRAKQAEADRARQAAAERAKLEAERKRATEIVATMDPRQATVALVSDARAAMAHADYRAAREYLQMALKLNPNNPEAQQLLEKANQGLAEQPLRQGLSAYFTGKYDDAEHYLSDYISSNNAPRRALAYFFRGASHSTRFYLSGESDSKQKSQALEDFHLLHKEDVKFRPPEKLVAPKVISLYQKSS